MEVGASAGALILLDTPLLYVSDHVLSRVDFTKAVTYNEVVATKRKNPAAVALGRKGGKKGGKARAAKMTPEERSESARKAVHERWKRYRANKALEAGAGVEPE